MVFWTSDCLEQKSNFWEILQTFLEVINSSETQQFCRLAVKGIGTPDFWKDHPKKE
jgi:hypothetical protein